MHFAQLSSVTYIVTCHILICKHFNLICVQSSGKIFKASKSSTNLFQPNVYVLINTDSLLGFTFQMV